MHLMIFSPGRVDHGFIGDDAGAEELYDMMWTAATMEQGNGRGSRTRKDNKVPDNRYPAGYKPEARRKL